MKTKKVPTRKCLATGLSFPKQELIRIVRTVDGSVVVDETGKINGRGAYVSKSLEAIDLLEKKKSLERELEAKVDPSIYETLRKIINE